MLQYFRVWDHTAIMSPAAKTQCHNIFCNPPDAPHFRLVIFVCRWYFRNVIPTARITFFASGSAHYVTTGTYTGMQPTSRKVHLALILCHCGGLGFCWWLSGMALAGQGHCRWHMSLCRPPLFPATVRQHAIHHTHPGTWPASWKVYLALILCHCAGLSCCRRLSGVPFTEFAEPPANCRLDTVAVYCSYLGKCYWAVQRARCGHILLLQCSRSLVHIILYCVT